MAGDKGERAEEWGGFRVSICQIDKKQHAKPYKKKKKSTWLLQVIIFYTDNNNLRNSALNIYLKC